MKVVEDGQVTTLKAYRALEYFIRKEKREKHLKVRMTAFLDVSFDAAECTLPQFKLSKDEDFSWLP